MKYILIVQKDFTSYIDNIGEIQFKKDTVWKLDSNCPFYITDLFHITMILEGGYWVCDIDSEYIYVKEIND